MARLPIGLNVLHDFYTGPPSKGEIAFYIIMVTITLVGFAIIIGVN